MPKRKAMSIDALVKKHQPTTETVEFYKTGVYSFDMLFGGRGLPKEAMLHIYSPSEMGKSTSLFYLLLSLAKRGIGSMYCDIERSQKLAEDMGVLDNEFIAYLQPTTYNEVQDAIEALFESDKQVIIIDSLTALVPGNETVREVGIEKATQIGADANMQSNFLKHYHAYMKGKGKTIIFITQERANINMKNPAMAKYEPDTKPAGGYAVKHYIDARMFLSLSRKLKESDYIQGGSSDTVIGRAGYIKMEKTRFDFPNVKVPMLVLFGRGVSNTKVLSDFVFAVGMCESKSGSSWITIHLPAGDEKCQGRPALEDLLQDSDSEVKKYAVQLMNDDAYCKQYFGVLRKQGIKK
jgi:RecA/RadA recombinase